ncbi:alpha/beta fold hydrolase [Actinacidiphila guanduensis]|uniref:alpha/beta fold hydrolase n=1 Tax=Actinacidiphila guanduensis TaxID=310781 RepID=UPI002B0010A6|nr:alpha/beta fold hydrolase [Actinacidiphila guanduensis]
MWRPQAAAFPGRRTIAPDLRGYGRSGPAAGTTRLEVFADDLAALLDALGVERAVVAGLSMGGQIVLEFQPLPRGPTPRRAGASGCAGPRSSSAAGRRRWPPTPRRCSTRCWPPPPPARCPRQRPTSSR